MEVRLAQIAYPAFYVHPTGITRQPTLPLRDPAKPTSRFKKMGWTMGLEPTTTGITSRGSTN